MDDCEHPKDHYLPLLIKNTRAARIQAEKRLLGLDALVKHATVYYSCLTLILSLAPLFLTGASDTAKNVLSFLSIASAAIITICTMYVSGQNYAVRAERMKFVYLELQRLWLEVDSAKVRLEEPELTKEMDAIGNRYVDIVASTENHTEEDYFIGKEGGNITARRYQEIRIWVLRTFIYVLIPLVLVLISLTICR